MRIIEFPAEKQYRIRLEFLDDTTLDLGIQDKVGKARIIVEKEDIRTLRDELSAWLDGASK